jgi:nickel/cobalt exporter
MSLEPRIDGAHAELRPGQGGLQTLRIEIELSAPLEPPQTTLTYRDRNYAGRVGWLETIAYPVDGQGIASSTVPSVSVSDELRSYPRDELSSPLRESTARVRVRPGASASSPVANPDAAAPADVFGGSFAALVQRDSSPFGAVVAFGLAIGFGALHALGPGHGKSVMAAYLLGASGRARHAVGVGVAVSVMHTASVIALGLLTLWAASVFPPENIYPYLSLVSGIAVLALGGWLLRVRLRARRARVEHHRDHDHSHDHADHDHHQVHDHGFGAHSHSPSELAGGVALTSWRGLTAIGLSGGLLPSPSALVVLLGAIALNRVAFGLTLVAGFSIGLAAALTILGLLVLKARAVAGRRLRPGAMAILPVLSAAAVTFLGLFLTLRSLLAL